MSRHLHIVASTLALAVSIGCGTDRPVQAPSQVQESTWIGDGSKPPSVARLQKEEQGGIVRTGLDDTLPEASSEVTNAQSAARILATVNAAPIFSEEVQATSFQFLAVIERLPEPERSMKRREILKEALDQLVERELIIQDAFNRLQKAGKNTLERLKEGANKEFDKRWVSAIKKGNNLKSDEELQELLRKQGLSLETIRRQWTRQFMATEYLRSRIGPYLDKISREQMLEYYEKHPEEFKIDDAVEWQDIFISANTPRQPNRDRAAAHKLAEELAARAKSGANFVALCKENDDGDSTLRNGAGIGRKRGEIQPVEIEPILFRMPEGEVGPVVAVPNGFHVIHLVKREYQGKRPFDEAVQKEIRNKLRGDIFGREAKKIVTELRRKAVIEYARGWR
ncbi:MAG: peptidyl-prolyl cis-trans isomerase [Planctomycetes bacterium]|nr:peptidyl-prolyl cis-trans isomerase [Planctomycetota bacterium]